MQTDLDSQMIETAVTESTNTGTHFYLFITNKENAQQSLNEHSYMVC